VQIIDVRSDAERQGFHLGGLHLPLTIIQNANGHNIVKDDVVFISAGDCEVDITLRLDLPCVVYCQSGKRSLEAVNLLRAMGLDNVKHLAGGVLAFLKA